MAVSWPRPCFKLPPPERKKRPLARRLTRPGKRFVTTIHPVRFSPLHRPAGILPPRTAGLSKLAHSPRAALGCLRKAASCRRAFSKTHSQVTQVDAGNSSVHTDLPLSHRCRRRVVASSRRCRRRPSAQRKPPVAILLLVLSHSHACVVSHLCLSSSPSP